MAYLILLRQAAIEAAPKEAIAKAGWG